MRYIQPNRDDTSTPIGSNYCVIDSNTLISYDNYTAYYYTRVSSAQSDWLYIRNYRYRDSSYNSNPCNGYVTYSVSQQYTPSDFASSLVTHGLVSYALLTLPIVAVIVCSRVWRLYRHRD